MGKPIKDTLLLSRKQLVKNTQGEIKFLQDYLDNHYCCDEMDFQDETNCIQCGKIESRIKLLQLRLEKEILAIKDEK
jgi:hypothetical protein